MRTYYEATTEALQLQISTAVRRYPQLRAVSEYYDLGMRTWKSESEIARVDEWVDSHEGQIHASLMQIAREELALITEVNGEPDGPANGSQPIRARTNRTPPAAGSRR